MNPTSTALTALIALIALTGPTPASAQTCPEIRTRLQLDGETTYYDYGDEIVIPPGVRAQVHVHVRSRSPEPYITSARVGRADGSPGDGSAFRLRAQSADDVRYGRIDFETGEPGTMQLAYTLEGVRAPGRLEDVAPSCRNGRVSLRVAAEETGEPGPGRPGWSLEEELEGDGQIVKDGNPQMTFTGVVLALGEDGTADIELVGERSSHWLGSWERVSRTEMRLVGMAPASRQGIAEGTVTFERREVTGIRLAGSLDEEPFELTWKRTVEPEVAPEAVPEGGPVLRRERDG